MEILKDCTDYDILVNNLNKKQLGFLEKILQHYNNYYVQHYNDNNYIEEYKNKYGNADIIDWYYGVIDTKEFINLINEGSTLYDIPL